MAVYFKFKSAKDYDSVSIDGHSISVANLKEKIVEQKKLGRGSDFDLVISNAQTNEEYGEEGFMVPKNTSVLVRRVPGRRTTSDVREERKPPMEVQSAKCTYQTVEPSPNVIVSTIPDGLDDFGVDLYAEPEVAPAPTVTVTEEEDNKIRAFVDASANDWQRQTQESYAAQRGYAKGGQGRGAPVRGYGRGFEKKNPPHGYVCHRCGVTGHYIQHCPTNGDPTYDIKKVKPPTGIPKTMLVANPDGSYALPSGEVAVLRPNEAVFDREVDGLPSTSRPMMDIPLELCCPLCKGVLKEAVLTSKCCFKSFCDKCIRNEIILKAKCVCGAKNILADDLLPNRTLRDAISRFMESQASAATSSGNVGSRAHLPDTESAPYAWPKRASPAVSISLKEASSVLVASDGSDTKEPFSGGKSNSHPHDDFRAVGKEQGFIRNFHKEENRLNVGKEMEAGDGSPESQLTKEPVLPKDNMSIEGTSRVHDESQEQIPHAIAAENGHHGYEPPKGKKPRKVKRIRQGADSGFGDGMWAPNANYNGQQAEMWCFHCGGYDHPHWLCYMSGPGPAHCPPPMQRPVFGPGYNPQMRGPMHHPMGDGYMMPYGGNQVPYNGYGAVPYEMPYNGPMVPHESFVHPHPMMMASGPPPQRDYLDPAVMSRDEFEARKAELKRRREREQRFGREQVKYPGQPVGREMEHGSDYPEEFSPPAPPGRRQRNVEHSRLSEIKATEPRRDWIERDEVSNSSHEKEPVQKESSKAKGRGRWARWSVDEGSSGEEISEERRYLRQEDNPAKQNDRTMVYKGSGDTGRMGTKAGQRLDRQKRGSVYESEDDVDLRMHSGSQAGPSTSPKSTRKRAISEEKTSRNMVEEGKSNVHTTSRGQELGRGPRGLTSKEGSRGSVFQRTDLKARRVAEEFSDHESQDLRVKLSKLGGSRTVKSREQVVEINGEEGDWHTGSYSRKKRRAEE